MRATAPGIDRCSSEVTLHTLATVVLLCTTFYVDVRTTPERTSGSWYWGRDVYSQSEPGERVVHMQEQSEPVLPSEAHEATRFHGAQRVLTERGCALHTRQHMSLGSSRNVSFKSQDRRVQCVGGLVDPDGRAVGTALVLPTVSAAVKRANLQTRVAVANDNVHPPGAERLGRTIEHHHKPYTRSSVSTHYPKRDCIEAFRLTGSGRIDVSMHRGIGRGHAVSNIAIVLEAYEAALRRIVAVAVAADLVVVRRESAHSIASHDAGHERRKEEDAKRLEEHVERKVCG